MVAHPGRGRGGTSRRRSSRGTCTLIRGADKSGGVFTPVGGALLRVHRALKHSFDPDGVFNRGRLYAGALSAVQTHLSPEFEQTREGRRGARHRAQSACIAASAMRTCPTVSIAG